MRCDRYGGLQLRSHFQSGKDRTAVREYDGWLCLNCGENIDPLILLNRIVHSKLHDHVPSQTLRWKQRDVGQTARRSCRVRRTRQGTAG